MKRSLKATLWLIVYFIIVLAPLILMFIVPRPEGRSFWREVSVALGYAGLSLMGLQFIPTARIPALAHTFSLDTLYTFHHNLSLASFGLVLAHPLILFINNPNVLQFLNVVDAPLPFQAGTFSFLALILLIASSVRRKHLDIEYEQWRLAHDIFAVGVVALAFLHIFGVNYYTAMPAQRILWIVLGLVWLGMLLYIRLIKPLMIRQRPYEVAEVIKERGETWTLRLKPVGHEGFNFNPGQVAWLSIYSSPFSIKEHPFSISSSAEEDDYYSFTIKELGDFTNDIGEVPVGETVYVDGPYGRFSIDDHEAPGYVFLAGGIGVAPFISTLRTMADRGDQDPVYLFYGNYNEEYITFYEELASLEEKLNLKVIHALEQPPEGWEGESGFINAAMLDRYLPKDRRQEYDYFICGPLPMIDAVTSAVRKIDIPVQKIHAEKYEMA